MTTLVKLLYWKLCFPEFVSLVPLQLRVVSGPFQEMAYSLVACASAHSAKLLGTYEKELHAIIRSFQGLQFETIIDIGAAEGYYAVGLARALGRSTTVVAFEEQELGRQLLQETTNLNRVTNLEIRGACDTSVLRAVLAGSSHELIICDVEGFELELLDPERVPNLRRCSILVELHDALDAPISSVIRERFHASHCIQEVDSVNRTWDDFPVKNLFAKLLPRRIALRAMNESRPSQKWFWMQPKE